MLATAVRMASSINGREVIVAIIGGTMLTLALTRPQLRWLRSMTAGNRSGRLWAERAITAFSFAMGGYAALAVMIALYDQLGPETDALLTGAACFLVVYAGFVHYEPFVCEWRLGRGMRALVLYLALVLPAAWIGAIIALAMLSSLSLREGVTTLIICGMGGTVWLTLYVLSIDVRISWRRGSPPHPGIPTARLRALDEK